MDIYTSYFANIRNLPRNCEPISIARYRPDWLPEIKQFLPLAPTPDMLNLPEPEYTAKYREIVMNLNADVVHQLLKQLAKGKVPVLCCYEPPGEFCHRHLAAKWLNWAQGLTVTEFTVKTTPKSQGSELFNSNKFSVNR